MRIIGRPELLAFMKSWPRSASPLRAWIAEVDAAQWKSPPDIKAKYAHASILKGRRVVFNIGGNRFRLVTKVNYASGVVVVRFIGTHAQYDQINAEEV
jgi:mRNA interferase HigB